jgi:hypothetical protein
LASATDVRRRKNHNMNTNETPVNVQSPVPAAVPPAPAAIPTPPNPIAAVNVAPAAAPAAPVAGKPKKARKAKAPVATAKS